nr:hypothetical protein [Tanacetum cinerariifolium]
MLDKTNYSSWAIRMLLYIKGKEPGKLLVDSVLNRRFQYGTMVEPENKTTPSMIRAQTYTDLTDEEKTRESVDITQHCFARQHEAHANEVRLARQRYSNQIALVANSPSCFNLTQYPQLSFTSQQYYPSPIPQRSYDAL